VCSSYGHVNQPARLRSYPSNLEDSTECSIWEAIRATSAAPLFFDPITFGKPPKTYVDGALHNNNPVRVLLDEAKSVWCPPSDRDIGCIISIGTGTPPLSPLGEGAIEIVQSLAKMATDTERTAREFKNEIYHLPLAERPAYFRFNVQRGLSDIGLEEWEHFNALTEATSAYLDDLREEIDRCVTALLPTPGM
jgi:predicted acylesterase/phospholipase RssA